MTVEQAMELDRQQHDAQETTPADAWSFSDSLARHLNECADESCGLCGGNDDTLF